jgi:hypothetical protein
MNTEDRPFQREKDIRAGKLDKELPGYEEITGWIQRVPMTWLPGILIRVVKQCVVRTVFKDKAALLRFAEKAMNENDFLSHEPPLHHPTTH